MTDGMMALRKAVAAAGRNPDEDIDDDEIGVLLNIDADSLPLFVRQLGNDPNAAGVTIELTPRFDWSIDQTLYEYDAGESDWDDYAAVNIRATFNGPTEV